MANILQLRKIRRK